LYIPLIKSTNIIISYANAFAALYILIINNWYYLSFFGSLKYFL